MAKKKIQPVPLNPTVQKDRMTVNYTIVHEHRGDQPHAVMMVNAKLCEETEQPYDRRFDLEERVVSLSDIGCWFDWAKAGTVVIANLEGRDAVAYPTEEERAILDKKSIEISAGEGLKLLVPAGWSQPIFFPADHSALQIRSLSGKVKCRVTVLPK